MNTIRRSLLVVLLFTLILFSPVATEAREYEPLVIKAAAYNSEPGTLSHEVKNGDTLFSIGRRYNVEVSLITALNKITNVNKITVGQELLIPVQFSFHKPVVVTTTSVNRSSQVAIQSVGTRMTSRSNNGFFITPTSGVITSLFGPRNGEFHAGLDLANDLGTGIYAAQDGIVIYAGWRGNYGKAVIIDHENGYKTLYGHNSEIIVKSNQRVKAGQQIAKMGSTGRSTGPHLHFEVHHDEKVVNPLEYISR